MLRTMMKSKIHRATVTQADLHYVGSVTVDEDLLDAADLLAGELVHIVDIDNGARLETYTIAGERGCSSRTWSSSTPTTRSWPPASTRPRPSTATGSSAATPWRAAPARVADPAYPDRS